MAPDYIRLDPPRLIQSAANHLMRYGIRKQHNQIGASNLLLQIPGHLGKDLRLTAMFLTNLLILAYHPVMPADNHNTHTLAVPFIPLPHLLAPAW